MLTIAKGEAEKMRKKIFRCQNALHFQALLHLYIFVNGRGFMVFQKKKKCQGGEGGHSHSKNKYKKESHPKAFCLNAKRRGAKGVRAMHSQK